MVSLTYGVAAAASSVSDVNFTPSVRWGAMATYWTVQFSTSAAGPLTSGTDTVTIIGPAGTAFSTTAADYKVNGTAATAVTATANTVTITVPAAVPASAGVLVAVTGVTNPAAPSSLPPPPATR